MRCPPMRIFGVMTGLLRRRGSHTPNGAFSSKWGNKNYYKGKGGKKYGKVGQYGALPRASHDSAASAHVAARIRCRRMEAERGPTSASLVAARHGGLQPPAVCGVGAGHPDHHAREAHVAQARGRRARGGCCELAASGFATLHCSL